MSKKDVLQKVSCLKNFKVKTSKVSAASDFLLHIDGKVLTKEGAQSLFSLVDADYSFFRKTTPKVKTAILQDYLTEKDYEFTAIEDSGKINFFVPGDYLSIPDVVETVTNINPDGDFQVFNEKRDFYVCYVLKKTRAIKTGDILQAGIALKISYGKTITYAVGAYIFRLICTNGMLSPSYRLHNMQFETLDSFKKELNAYYTACLNAAESGIESFVKLIDKKVTDPSAYIHGFSRSNGISSADEKQILDLVPTITDNNEFELLNLVTNYANSKSPRGWFNLIGKAGIPVFDEIKCCTKCYRKV
jgi:hypothetical protein